MSLLGLTTFSQNNKIQKFNFGFEEAKSSIPTIQNWSVWGDYGVRRDSNTTFTNKYAGRVEALGDGNSFDSIAFTLPNNFKGREIKLEGYLKILGVENSFTGLMLRLDKYKNLVGFDNMENQNIIVSHDWKNYTNQGIRKGRNEVLARALE